MRQPRESAGPARGILRLPPDHSSHEHHRILPRPELRELIAHFWWVSWSLATPQRVETLSHPSVHLVFEEGPAGNRAEVVGVPRAKFSRELSGAGRVFGVKFRPATFRALYDGSLSRLTGKVLPGRDALGRAALELEGAIFGSPTMSDRLQHAEEFFMGQAVVVSPALAALRDLVEAIAADPSLVRVEQLAERAGVDRRTLERRFRDAVGVSPKWVIRRYRLHEAADRLRRGDPLIEVAHALNYADQSHFTRDFKVEVGLSPLAFLKRERSGES